MSQCRQGAVVPDVIAQEQAVMPATTVKYCGCQCGLPAPNAPRTDRSKGWAKEEPIRFRSWHHARLQRRQDRVTDFLALVDRTTTPDGCYEFTGYRDKHGYGVIRINGRKRRAHVVAPVLFGSLEASGCWRLDGATGLGTFLVRLVPSGLLAREWRERVGRQVRAFGRFRADRRLRTALARAITRLAVVVREL